jgi:hypothetical protein
VWSWQDLPTHPVVECPVFIGHRKAGMERSRQNPEGFTQVRCDIFAHLPTEREREREREREIEREKERELTWCVLVTVG